MLSEAKKRFVFYDTETSGLSAEFDQIAQQFRTEPSRVTQMRRKLRRGVQRRPRLRALTSAFKKLPASWFMGFEKQKNNYK